MTSTTSYSLPAAASQIHTVLSLPQVAKKQPLGDHATFFTSLSWPSNMATFSQLLLLLESVGPMHFQMAVVLSNEAVARHLPSGDQQQDRTVRECASSRRAMHCQEAVEGCFAQRRMVLSPLQVAKMSPGDWKNHWF